jgi:(E)-4-hydroxy-3-methylbut-2-enyl-diphosphate synthase
MKRHQTKQVEVGNLLIGGNDEIVIQSMCNIKTSKVDEVVKQILLLEEYGCQLIRVSVLDSLDALSIKEIKNHIHIPIVADIHFDYKLALLSIENGADKVRLNPGNIDKNHIKDVVDMCKKYNVPIRIGINSGSLEEDLKEKYGVSEITMIESAKRHIKILEDLSFYNIVLSLKSSDFNMCVKAYEMASELFEYPLHIGITEPGPLIPGIIKSTLGLSNLIDKGIGSTIRISLSDDPVNEIKVAKQLLSAKGLIKMPILTSCPTCGRTKIDLIKYANQIEDYLYRVNKNLKVAVMGCVVNGPGEAKDADIGVAGSNNVAVLFKKGQIIKTINEEDIVEELIKYINEM